MTKKEAQKLRALWEQTKATKRCLHKQIVLEHTERGYLTGRYVCIICGASIPRSRATPP